MQSLLFWGCCCAATIVPVFLCHFHNIHVLRHVQPSTYLVESAATWANTYRRSYSHHSYRENSKFKRKSTLLQEQHLRELLNSTNNRRNRIEKDSKWNQFSPTRRHFVTAWNVLSITTAGSKIHHSPMDGTVANAAIIPNIQIPYQQSSQHRQIEVCLVCLLRVLYWVQYQLLQLDNIILSDTARNTITANKYNDIDSSIDQQLCKIYVETRIGAKALLSGRLSSGITSRTYTLISLQFTGCIQDIEWYAATYIKSKIDIQHVIDLCTSFREGLASIVEFDGFDTLIYPSPRLEMIQAQYNRNKLQFIRRILQDQVLLSGKQLAACFDTDTYERSYRYIQQYYVNEITDL